MIRFLADACVRRALVTGCRRREPLIDIISSLEAGIENASDPEVLGLRPIKGES